MKSNLSNKEQSMGAGVALGISFGAALGCGARSSAGSGTGFVAKIPGKKIIMTNERRV